MAANHDTGFRPFSVEGHRGMSQDRSCRQKTLSTEPEHDVPSSDPARRQALRSGATSSCSDAGIDCGINAKFVIRKNARRFEEDHEVFL